MARMRQSKLIEINTLRRKEKERREPIIVGRKKSTDESNYSKRRIENKFDAQLRPFQVVRNCCLVAPVYRYFRFLLFFVDVAWLPSVGSEDDGNGIASIF